MANEAGKVRYFYHDTALDGTTGTIPNNAKQISIAMTSGDLATFSGTDLNGSAFTVIMTVNKNDIYNIDSKQGDLQSITFDGTNGTLKIFALLAPKTT